MDKSIKIYIGILLLIFTAIIAIDLSKPVPVNWTPTYDVSKKNPLDLFVLNEELPEISKQKIHQINVTPYEYFKNLYDYDSLVDDYKIHGTFLNIANAARLDRESITELFYYAGHGNTIFLSDDQFPKALLDSLKLETAASFEYKDAKLQNWLANTHLGTKKYNLVEGIGNTYFSKIDTLKTTILGYQNDNDSSKVNFVKVPYRNGNFILHTQPAAFSNFHLLKDDHAEYAEKVLSYLPKKDIYWYVKNQNGETISNSKLRYIFSQPALKSAWLLFIIGMLFFIIFNAKRKQRVVPILNPLTNTTIDFAKTIGNLYFQEGDHDNIINKKIIYFLEKVRQDYLMDTAILDELFIKRLQHKTGKNIRDIERVVQLINTYRKGHFTSVESDLLNINEAIEKIIN